MRSAHKLMFVVGLMAIIAVTAGMSVCSASKIVVEAEHYYQITPSMVYATSQVASGGYYIWIPLHRPHGEDESGPADSGNALFLVYFPTDARYTLWGRCHWHDGCGNSFFVYMDRDTTPAVFGDTDGTYQVWHWVKGKSYDMTAGWHYIRWQYREDGAKLDQFLFTTDSRYVPVRAEKETPEYLKAAEQ